MKKLKKLIHIKYLASFSLILFILPLLIIYNYNWVDNLIPNLIESENEEEYKLILNRYKNRISKDLYNDMINQSGIQKHSERTEFYKARKGDEYLYIIEYTNDNDLIIFLTLKNNIMIECDIIEVRDINK